MTVEPQLPEERATHLSKAAPGLLRTLFLHHDGIVVGATIAALAKHGLLELLFREKRLDMRQILGAFPCNAGYVHVALRCLALQGWLTRSGDPGSDHMVFEVSPAGEIASTAFDRYVEGAGFVYSGIPMDAYLFGQAVPDKPSFECYAELVRKAIRNWGLPPADPQSPHAGLYDTIGRHLDGMLVGPLMIAAKMRGLLEGDSFLLHRTPGSRENVLVGLELLRHLGWIGENGDRAPFTELGRAACDFSLHYGLTLSYAPMFARLPELIFGSLKQRTHERPGQEETHVDRTLNVLASGVAHRPYFEDSDAIIGEIFNQEPLAEQPRFVADMGCGDGAWLERIYKGVTTTLRGRSLDRYPFLAVGADFNARALDVARRRLHRAGVPAITLFGDITDPDHFAAALAEHGLEICDGLHIRAFIDHNRRYVQPLDLEKARGRAPLSSGAYADENGWPIANGCLEQNLVEHFRRWAPYVKKHGLIIIEAHDVDPRTASRYNGRTHATAFDTYHGYSNQYPVDFEAFMDLAEEAGLRSVLYQQRVYPSRLPFVAISLNRFKTAESPQLGACEKTIANDARSRVHGWRPGGAEDLADGEALHRLLYRDGDITRPRRWCFASTGRLVGAVLEELEKRLARCRLGQSHSPEVTVVDYGAGTGLATLELIKGLYDRALLQRFEHCGVELKLLLFDLPSGWFAKAHELLKDLSFVDFHSLQDPLTGKIRFLSEVIGQGTADIIFASMVLHLIPPKAMPVLFDSFAASLKPGGRFVWNTPDTSPAASDAEVIHAANRALRRAISAVLDDAGLLSKLLARVTPEEGDRYAGLLQDVEQMRRRLTPALRAQARAAGATQILAVPTDAGYIHRALAKRFAGELSTMMSVLREDDVLALALLPANQRYFSEVDDPRIREQLISLLLKHEVLPRLREGRAGNPAGLNLHWTFGDYSKL